MFFVVVLVETAEPEDSVHPVLLLFEGEVALVEGVALLLQFGHFYGGGVFVQGVLLGGAADGLVLQGEQGLGQLLTTIRRERGTCGT